MNNFKLVKHITLFWIGLVVLTTQALGQDNAIAEIKFNFLHSLRIPNHHVTVEFQKFEDSVSVQVESTPLHKSPKWDSTKRKYSFNITKDAFDKVVASVRSINCSDILNDLTVKGKDGTTCEITFGNYNTAITYSVWAPEFYTKERFLQAFLQSCRLILQTAKLDPDAIF